MRRILLVSLFMLAALPALPSAAQRLAGSCSFAGTWRARSGFVTVIDEQRQWRTYATPELMSVGTVAGQGWVIQSEQGLTFDYEGAEHGYEYEWRFADDCRRVELTLARIGETPVQDGFQIHFTRLE